MVVPGSVPSCLSVPLNHESGMGVMGASSIHRAGGCPPFCGGLSMVKKVLRDGLALAGFMHTYILCRPGHWIDIPSSAVCVRADESRLSMQHRHHHDV